MVLKKQVKNRWILVVRTAIGYPYYKDSPLRDHGNQDIADHGNQGHQDIAGFSNVKNLVLSNGSEYVQNVIQWY